MSRVWKEIIPDGTYCYLDREGNPRTLVAPPERIKHWHDSGKAMIAAGLSIPIPIEHQPDSVPQTAAQRAANHLLNQAGEVKDFRLDGNKLFGLCDITDPKVREKIPSTIRFTSPWINSFTDGDGKKWDDVITHLALTSRPRIHRQQPFPDFEAALSLATPEKGIVPEGGILLSRAGKLVKGKKGLRACYPGSFAEWAGIKLAAEAPPMEKKEEVKKPPEKGEEKLKKEEEPKSGEEPEIEAEVEMDLADVLCDIMSILGVEMPEGTTEENLLQNLLKATMEHLKLKHQTGDEMPTNTPPEKPPVTPPVIAEQPPMYMSLEAIEKHPDPLAKSLAKKALKDAGEGRKVRIARIAKKMGPAQRTKFLAQAATMEKGAMLSLDGTGSVHDPMASALDIIEAGLVDLPAMLSGEGGQEEAHPVDKTNEITADRMAAVEEEMARNSGVPLVPKKDKAA